MGVGGVTPSATRWPLGRTTTGTGPISRPSGANRTGSGPANAEPPSRSPKTETVAPVPIPPWTPWKDGDGAAVSAGGAAWPGCGGGAAPGCGGAPGMTNEPGGQLGGRTHPEP